MKKSKFDKTRFWAGMQVKYHDSIYYILSVNFEERLIGINWHGEIFWIRCENCEIK